MRLWVVLVFAVSLLLSCESQGPSAVTVFVQKGGDVLLNFDADVPEDFSFVEWKFNKTVVLVKIPPGDKEPTVFSGYTGRIEFPEKKYSVKLKNLTEADRGVYTAKLVSAREEDRTLAKYNVTVQDPVSPVNLTVISVDSRSSECNLTVTCRTQDSHINSTLRCDNQTCSQEGGEQSEVTTSGASLRIYLSSSSIICNHSNQISWTKVIKIIEHVSPQPDDSKQGDSNDTGAVVAVCVLIPLLLIACVLGLCAYHRKKGNYNRESIENTVYEIPQHGTTAQPLDQSPTDDASGLSPTSTYCLVGPHTGPPDPNKTRDTTVPESLYESTEFTSFVSSSCPEAARL